MFGVRVVEMSGTFDLSDLSFWNARTGENRAIKA